MIRITWEVEDGYAGKSRPHFITLSDFDEEDYLNLESEDEKITFLDEIVQIEFENSIYPVITNIEKS